MNIIQKIGIALFIIAFSIFTLSLGLDSYTLTEDALSMSSYQKEAVIESAKANGLLNKQYSNNFDFISDLKSSMKDAQANQLAASELGIPEGVNSWDFLLENGKIKEYMPSAVKASADGLVANNKGLFWLLTIGLGVLGGLIYILPTFLKIPGIKNNQIYQNSMTRGLTLNVRSFFLATTVVGVLLYGVFYTN